MYQLVATLPQVSLGRPARHTGLFGPESAGARHIAGHGHHGAEAATMFAAMGKAFRPSGGMARGEDLVHTMAAHRQGDYASLARQIVEHDVLCFDWDASYWLPMFQFDMHDLSVRRDLLPVFWELHHDCDGWALASWFARPHAALHGRVPVDLLDSELAAVLAAAGASRRIETS